MMPVYNHFGSYHPAFGDTRLSMQDENIQRHAYTGGGFSFQKRHGRIDWKKLAAVDIEHLSRDVDVQTLQDNVEHVAFCDIDTELNLKDNDASLKKMFKLAQLLIEYLLHSQEYLQGYINQTDAQMQKFVQDQANLQTELDRKNNIYRSLKKEYQKSKKLISEYQLMLRAGASGMHKCSFCSKSFLNDEFLKSHILRRHADQNIQPWTQRPQKTFENSAAIGQPGAPGNEELLRELNLITSRLQETESRLIAERIERDRKYEAEREIELKRLEDFSKIELSAKDNEISKLKVTVEEHKEMFTKEINKLCAEKNAMQKDFDALRQSQVSKPSMLGNLQDVSAEERQEEEIAKIKEQLQRELNASYQEEVRKLRSREDLMKKSHNEEIGQIKRTLSKYENALEKAEAGRIDQARYLEEIGRYKQTMDEQTKKMLTLEEMIKSQKNRVIEDDDMIEETRLKQQEVFASTPLLKGYLDTPKDLADSDENLVLYVASNSKNNFRVWKSPSRSQSDWKDSFNFKANVIEKGQFNIPIYVYCASGSPYWRQYVSSSSKPPRPSYKLDFIFYVSDVQLMGTVKLHVLQSGSGEVVRSMISKSDIYPGWKQKGLSFFVMKGPSFQGIAKSVSFQSTLNESELDSEVDEVSVSSYTGTEDARKNLAVAIAKSREDLMESEEEEEVRAIRKEDTLTGQQSIEKEEEDEEKEDEREDDEDEDASFDETDGKLATTESTSQWGSTLLQTGSFLPFPNNPLAIARYNHSKEMIESCREVAIEVLNSNLERRGVDLDAPGMTNDQYESKMKLHVNEVNTFAKENADATANRKRLVDTLDQIARERLGIAANVEESKTPDKSKSKFKSAVSKIKNATIFGRASPRKKEDSKHKLKDSNSRPNSFISEPPSPKTPKLSQSTHSIEELGPVSEQKSISKQERESDVNDEIFDNVSENVKWDSDESEILSDDSLPPAGGTAQLPKVTVSQPGRSNYEPSSAPRIAMRKPKGEKVRALTASLEASLMARHGIKKPAGAIDIHGAEKTDEMSSQREQGKLGDGGDFDDDDDDDFDLSSLDEEDYREFARTKKEADEPMTTFSRPSPQQNNLSKLPPEKTPISKFPDFDDFDSDEGY